MPARASPAASRRSRSSRSSSGVGSHRATSGSSAAALQPEQLQEQRRRAVEDGAELGAAALLDQPAVEQRRDRRVGVDAADARDLRPRDGLQVGDDRERLELRRRQRREPRLRQQRARRVLGDRVARERAAAGELAQQEPALARARTPSPSSASASPSSSSPAPVTCASSARSTGSRAEEQQRLDDPRELAHALRLRRPARAPQPAHGDLAERLGLLPARLAALVQLEQRPERDRDRHAVGVADGVVEAERDRRAQQRRAGARRARPPTRA